jgi:hypothetical protein
VGGRRLAQAAGEALWRIEMQDRQRLRERGACSQEHAGQRMFHHASRYDGA